MDKEQILQEMLNGDFNDDKFVAQLMYTARNEPDDLIRSYAYSLFKEKSFKIVDRLLKQ